MIETQVHNLLNGNKRLCDDLYEVIHLMRSSVEYQVYNFLMNDTAFGWLDYVLEKVKKANYELGDIDSDDHIDLAIRLVNAYGDVMGDVAAPDDDDLTAEEIINGVINFCIFIATMSQLYKKIPPNGPIFGGYQLMPKARDYYIDLDDYYNGPSFGSTHDYETDLAGMNAFIFSILPIKGQHLVSPDGSEDFCIILEIAPDYTEILKKSYLHNIAAMPVEYALDYDSYETDDQVESHAYKADIASLGTLCKRLKQTIVLGCTDPKESAYGDY